MSVYERTTRVEAPFEDVWAFHAGVSGLVALTPEWMRLRIERVRGPDGDDHPDVLTPGSEVVASVRPFGIGPRSRWRSTIVEREEGDGRARFVDEMTEGPFARWRHAHSFEADGDATVCHDRVEYDLPGGPLGRALGPLAYVGLEPMFRYRHRELRARFGD
jgi:ligand-binding SRPBCC domain-containing protein